MADRYTIMQSLPESVTRPTRDQAIQLAKEYITEHKVGTIYVVRVVATVEAQITHKTSLHARGG